MNSLFIIPARKGSKGLPGKNIKNLNGKPLIFYTIDFAQKVKKEKDVICISTDDENVIEFANLLGVNPPFIRPAHLSSDTASTFDVIKHCLDFYIAKNMFFKTIVLLQPTSPIRSEKDFMNMMCIFNESKPDMIVSVIKAKHNPFFSLFQLNDEGFLNKFSSNISFNTRQECPVFYAYNGSIYVVSVDALSKHNRFDFEKIMKYEMDNRHSIDIDTKEDWELAEFYINKIDENS
jgi:CMP-N,N'-diacetyllegionaminic acid synthase